MKGYSNFQSGNRVRKPYTYKRKIKRKVGTKLWLRRLEEILSGLR